MTAATFILHRYEDKSGVSGTGQVAEGVEFSDGSVALRWHGEHPSTAAWNDIRDVEAIHGHGGLTVVEYADPNRLVKAYAQVTFWLLSARYHDRPLQVKPHPDWPDRLLLTFRDERVWRFWIGLMDGSAHAATHVVEGEQVRHTWITPSGDCWLQYTTEITEDPLDVFDREDRG